MVGVECGAERQHTKIKVQTVVFVESEDDLANRVRNLGVWWEVGCVPKNGAWLNSSVLIRMSYNTYHVTV